MSFWLAWLAFSDLDKFAIRFHSAGARISFKTKCIMQEKAVVNNGKNAGREGVGRPISF